jgi:hypothetical protein
VSAQSNAVDGVPLIDGVEGEEGFALVGGDSVNAGVSVVHQQVELAVLLSLDALEESFHLFVVGVVDLRVKSWSYVIF